MPQFYRTGDPVKFYRDGRIATVLEARSFGSYLVIIDGEVIPFVAGREMFELTTRTPGAHAAVEEPLAPAVDPEHHAERYDPELLAPEEEVIDEASDAIPEFVGDPILYGTSPVPAVHNRWDPDCTENADFGHMDRYARCVICKPLQPVEADVPETVEEPLTVTTTAPKEDVPHGQLTTRSTPYTTRLHKDDVEADDGVIRGMLYGTGPVPVVPPGPLYAETTISEENGVAVARRAANPESAFPFDEARDQLDKANEHVVSAIAEGRRKIEADLIEETTSTPEARLDMTRRALEGALRDLGATAMLRTQLLGLFDRGVALGKAIGR